MGWEEDGRIAQAEDGAANGDSNGSAVYDPTKFDEDGKPRRKGNVMTTSAHVITAVIGSGVLSLAWSIAQMGWIAGPFVLLLFGAITYYTSCLLADCYRYPDPVTGKRNYTYMETVQANLGPKQVWACGLAQYSNLLGTSIGYIITGAQSARAITKSNCFHSNPDSPCIRSNNGYMISFGIVQLVLSQIPNFGELWWLSYLAAAMSLIYSTTGLGLSIGKIAEGGYSHGSISGTSIGDPSLAGYNTRAQKTWNVFNALGDMAFAYSFSMILIEIQDTLRAPPAENKSMKRATLIGILTSTGFYMSVGCAGYAAFGNASQGNLLTGFGFYNPYWLVDFANACVVVHLIGAYQVYTQPLYAFIEEWVSSKFPKSNFINKEHYVKLPFGEPLPINHFRLVWRSIYVVMTTIVSMLLPFFNDILGLIGACGFWPLTVYFPVEMYIHQTRLPRWSQKWILLQSLSVVTFVVSLAAAIGSVASIVSDVQGYKPFSNDA
ncbi:unnamed protein product [Sphagnum jensenii]|uniref:Amino acid transporter transmembrane domain-containing protein n=1 Tax=Sphagnum jensenii TaxID=128206 RepID=A0ABP0X3K3_9BRYO